MSILIVGLVVIVAAVLTFLWANERSHDGLAFAAVVAGVASVLFVIISALVCITNRVGVGGELVQINEVRRAASHLHGVNASQVYGDAVETNQLIASNQWYRRQWWARDFVASSWDTVSVIALPDTAAAKP